MGRPPSIPVEKKTRLVLSVPGFELSIVEVARREKVPSRRSAGGRPISWRAGRPRWRQGGTVRPAGSSSWRRLSPN
jgi:hypothetical protein